MQERHIGFTASIGERSEALVLGLLRSELTGRQHSIEFAGKSSKAIEQLLQKARRARFFGAKKNEVSLLRFYQADIAPNTVLLGLGTSDKWTQDIARQCGAALLQIQKKEHLRRMSVLFDSVFGKTPHAELPNFFQAFCEGYLLAGYEYTDLKKADPERFEPEGIDFVGGKSKGLEDSMVRAGILARSVNFARSLGDRPGNYLTPSHFVQLTQKMAKEQRLSFKVLGRKEIESERMGLLLGVAKGSNEEPKFIILEHRGGRKTERPIALVGKGITFDSGGISIKPSARMEEMKYDMMGGAAVAGICQAAAAFKVPHNIVGFIAAAENLPGGRAQKPGDVARSMTGKTVEITNTDAEGRLILADALEYAQKYYHPQVIIDFATLTGAVVDALGSVTTGIMGNHPELIARIKKSADITAERVWELPIYDEYEEDLKSPVADIKNSGIREAGASKGAIFLRHFVQSKYPWVHCDIAGTAYHRKDLNYHPQKYGAGVMVRLITHLLENWEPLK